MTMNDNEKTCIRYYVIAKDGNGFTTVGYDNEPTDSIDNAMIFDTEEDAARWIESSEGQSWVSSTLEIVELNDEA